MLMLVGLGITVSVGAMPTQRALEKAEPNVVALVADIAKREQNESVRIATEIQKLEKEAENAVEKFLLSREAVRYLLMGGQLAPARAVLTRFHEAGDDKAALVIDRYAQGFLDARMRSELRKDADFVAYQALVKSLGEAMRERGETERRLASLEAAYRKNPTNLKVCKRLAVEYAVRAIWDKALPLFAQTKGDLGEAARVEQSKSETKGADAAAIGDAWWKIDSRDYSQRLVVACRQHAAVWYRTALAEEPLSNLVKLRITGRIEEVKMLRPVSDAEHTSSPAVVPSSVAPSPVATPSDALGTAGPLSFGEVKGGTPIRILLEAKSSIFLNLVACEPGTFTMGESGDFCDRKHTVKLTYPYLIQPGHLTYGMVKAVDRKVWKKRMDALPPDDAKFNRDGLAFAGVTDGDLAEFLTRLNAMVSKCRDLHAFKGYEFRLPTEAEWVRAYQADGSDEMEGVSEQDIKAYWTQRGESGRKSWPPEDDILTVLKKKPNAWGIFGMTCAREDLADLITMPIAKNGQRAFWLPDAARDVLRYADLEENPIRVCADKNACHLARKGKMHKNSRPIVKTGMKGEVIGGSQGCQLIRLVYGPKLDKLNVYPKPAPAEKK